jgi:hemerythrin-like metal-binding protein
MALIEWKKEYSVGNEAIDHEHQHMIEQINHLCELLEEPTDDLYIETSLGNIQADISAHFALEELLMRKADYAEYEAHKDDHEDLLDQIHNLIFSFTDDSESGRELVMNQISDWFGRHFSTFDSRLHKQLG